MLTLWSHNVASRPRLYRFYDMRKCFLKCCYIFMILQQYVTNRHLQYNKNTFDILNSENKVWRLQPLVYVVMYTKGI